MSLMRINRKKGSFTLIEMLVVIIIIIILLGILFRIMSLVSGKINKAQANYELQQFQNALTEYYSEYGSFPPVDFVAYEYESSTNQSQWFRETFLPNHNTLGSTNPQTLFFSDVKEREGRSDWNLGYRYGLVSYLYPRKQGDQVHYYNADTERDTRAKLKWSHFIKDIGPDGGGPVYHATPPGLESQAPYSNGLGSLTDPWGNEYRYICKPPYIRYKLWSAGPDGIDGTWDDINLAQQK